MKSLIETCADTLRAFPPGHYFTLETGVQRYYTPRWADVATCTGDVDLALLRQALIDATEKRLMTDVPLGKHCVRVASHTLV
jgi:asparagine synthase (glutamine-hydrolysing)